MAEEAPRKTTKELREDQKAMNRRRAKEDFIALGARRSVKKLFEKYKVQAKEKGRETVPTLHLPDLYLWAREDGWYAEAISRDEKEIESDSRDYQKIRQYRMDDLHDLSGEAISALHQILTAESLKREDSVRLNAAQDILDRIGLGVKKGLPAESKEEEPLLNLPADLNNVNLADLYQQMKKRQPQE